MALIVLTYSTLLSLSLSLSLSLYHTLSIMLTHTILSPQFLFQSHPFYFRAH